MIEQVWIHSANRKIMECRKEIIKNISDCINKIKETTSNSSKGKVMG